VHLYKNILFYHGHEISQGGCPAAVATALVCTYECAGDCMLLSGD